MKQLAILLFAGIFISSVPAQENQVPSPIIFIYDASGSMWGQIKGKTKKEIAAGVLVTSVNNLPDNQKLGLVVYGHRKEGDCRDVEFMVDVHNGTKELVNQSLEKIKPLGKTPLAYSITQVIDKLKNSSMKATVILVTDGIESCDGDICDVVTKAKNDGIEFRLHIVGFGLKAGETGQLECAASAGGGRYYDAEDAQDLTDVLNEATNITVDKPASNFTIYAVKNGNPVDAYVKAVNSKTKKDAGAARTYRDTAHLYLAPGLYDLEVNPLEGSDVSAVSLTGIQIVEDKKNHQTVSFDAGKILVTALNNGEPWDAVVRIFPAESSKNVAGGRTYGKADEYELNPGVYNVELQALVLNGTETIHLIENIEVLANETKEVKHNFKSGTAMIGAKSTKGLVDAVVKVIDKNSGKNVAGGRTYTSESGNPKKILLNPGTYEVTLTALGEFHGKTKTFTLNVKEGETIENIMDF